MLGNNKHRSCAVNLAAFISVEVIFSYSFLSRHQKEKNKRKTRVEAHAQCFSLSFFAKEKKQGNKHHGM